MHIYVCMYTNATCAQFFVNTTCQSGCKIGTGSNSTMIRGSFTGYTYVHMYKNARKWLNNFPFSLLSVSVMTETEVDFAQTKVRRIL